MPSIMASPSVAIAYSSLTVAAVLWGGSIVGQKYALASFSSVEVSVLRGIGALAILIPLWWLQEGQTIRLAGRDRWLLVLLGLAVLGNHLLTLFGLRYIGAAAAGVSVAGARRAPATASSTPRTWSMSDAPSFPQNAANCPRPREPPRRSSARRRLGCSSPRASRARRSC